MAEIRELKRPEERLHDIAVHALTSTHDWQAAMDALLEAVRNDATLLRTLFAPHQDVAVQKLLQSANEAHSPAAQPVLRDRRSGMEAVANVHRLSLLDRARKPRPRRR